MKFEQLILLLPCHSLESLSLDRSTDEAEQILSAWTALFHPALLSSAGNVPEWRRADEPPQEMGGSLVVIPRCTEDLLPEGWLDRAQQTAALVVRNVQQRDRIVAAALALLDPAAAGASAALAADFFALGFCNLLVELLTRQLRYMSNLDAEQFKRKAVAAAQYAVQGEQQPAREELQSAFDVLTEAREYFYPVETHLLDLTLVAPTTAGESLRRELSGGGPVNLLMSGAVAEQLARQDPATLALLKEALDQGTAHLVGGEYEEHELPLLPPEAVLEQLRRGLACYERHLGRRPALFGRRRFGLWPILPQVLEKLGFSGAVHFTLDDGRFPTGNQSKIRWEGLGGNVIEALVRLPLNAAKSEHFLSLPKRLGDTMDLDHAATVVFAHWPDQVSPWYRDLRRTAVYSPVLGRFAAMGDYFQTTQLAGKLTQHRADQYKCPYLRQAAARAQPDPISRWVRYYRRRAAIDALEWTALMAALIGGPMAEPLACEGLRDELEAARADPADTSADLDARLADALSRAAARMARALPRTGATAERGYLAINPCSFSRQTLVETPRLSPRPAVAGPVRAVHESATSTEVLVETPAMGFAWVGAGSGEPQTPIRRQPAKKAKEDPPLVEEHLLRNEFFELRISPATGAIQAIHEYELRGNRLGQQIALRTPGTARRPRDLQDDDSEDRDYTTMAAEEISIACAGPLRGEIVSRGHLLDAQGERVAAFRQSTVVRRGSRVIELGIELDIQRAAGENPWDSYYAVRFAWPDESTQLYRSVNLCSCPTEASLLESPYFVDLRTAKSRTTILAAGLPYHRKIGLRKLDSILVVQGETARSFRLGIGVGLSHPAPAALDFLAPHPTVTETAPPTTARSGWLFHVDARNVVATHWSPIPAQGRATGVRLRLLETRGRPTRLAVRSFRPLRSARKVDYLGGQASELAVEADRVTLQVAAYEWVQVEIEFAQ